MDDGKVTVTIEVDAELLAQVTEVLKPYGLTPEDAVVQFIEYCVAPETQDRAIKLLKRWKKEQEEVERRKTSKLPPLSELERIEQALFAEQLDEILERIDKENTAFVITKDGTDQVVICPYRWFAENFPEEVPEGI